MSGRVRMSGRAAITASVVLTAVSTCLSIHLAMVHSPVFSEVGHLPAGISHWKFDDYSLYRVNPPLPRMVAAIPVMLTDYQEKWNEHQDSLRTRYQIVVGRDFVRANGIDHQRLYTLGRLANIPFVLLGAWGCFLWSRQLWGNLAGVGSLSLWCFSPMILGNGALIMPDVPAASLGLWSAYTFWKWLKQPTLKLSLLAGLLLGLAQLTKFTLLIFYLLFPLLWLVGLFSVRSRSIGRNSSRNNSSPSRLKELAQLVLIFLLSLYVINVGYGFNGSGQRLADYTFYSRALSGRPPSDKPIAGNRFSDHWLGRLPVPLPADYVQGLDRQKSDFDGRMWSYLRGEWKLGGWWYFYLYAFLIKTPMGILILYGLTLLLLFRKSYRTDPVTELCILLPVVLVWGLVSSQTAFSIHPRYLIPTLPFLFVSAGRVALLFHFKHHILSAITLLSLGWAVASSLWFFPHNLAYFNESVGGPKNGHRHLLDSGSAWGQDLLFLKRWYDDHPQARPLHIASFGWVDPRHAGLEYSPVPVGPAQPGNLGTEELTELGPRPGWYAIDVNHVMGTVWGTPTGDGGWKRFWMDFGKPIPDFRYFQHFKPTQRVAYSYLVYHLKLDEVNRVRREVLDLPELPANY